MTNKIIYPILIIIFSILIVFAIINNKSSSALNKCVEKFTNGLPIPSAMMMSQPVNYNLPTNQTVLTTSAANNNTFNTQLINGPWTCDLTTVDSNYIASNLLEISLNNNTNTGTITNYGTVTYNNQTYTIIFLLNNVLTAVVYNSSGQETNETMSINFFNNYTQEGQVNINPPFYKPEEFNSAVSIFNGNTLITKFASYKVYNNNTVGSELYRIIIAQAYQINTSPPVYDYPTYNVIIDNYQYPPNFITFTFGTSNSGVINTLNTYYQNNISMAIQRVFTSPTGASITTKVSKRIELSAVSNNQIPTNITVCSFQSDQATNNLNSFFTPKSTILYFYKYQNMTVTYDYANGNISKPNSVLNLKNSANNMTESTIQYNDLSSVEKIDTYSYIITLVGTYNSNLSDTTVINFSDLINKL